MPPIAISAFFRQMGKSDFPYQGPCRKLPALTRVCACYKKASKHIAEIRGHSVVFKSKKLTIINTFYISNDAIIFNNMCFVYNELLRDEII